MAAKLFPSLLTFVVFAIISYSVAFFGAQFEPGEWYAALAKPEWTPPDAVFAPVWAVLYLMIAISGWLAWRSRGYPSKTALVAFFVQLALNAVWSWLFFGLHRPDLAFVEIVVLWAAIFTTVVLFWRIRRTAGLMLIPYLLWVGFAAALNWQIWQLNI